MTDNSKLYDVVIVGAGPAGLTAAIYLARARYRVLVVEKDKIGGQITITEEVVNYPGIVKTSGTELTESMRVQAVNFGAEFLMAEVTGIQAEGDIKIVHTSKGDLECFGVLLAIGSTPRSIGFPGEEEFKGHGVAYCATCDGEFFTGKDVFVIGGGFAAAEESVFLTKYAKEVHILLRKDDFSCAPAASEEARNHPKITIHPNTVVEALEGDSVPRVMRYRNVKTDEVTIYEPAAGDTFGVFVLAGYVPATGVFRDIVELADSGHIVTDAQCRTSAEGIYAAGDVCVKSLRQVVTATGEAAAAATEMERYIKAMQESTGLVPQVLEVGKPGQPVEQAAVAASPSSAASDGKLFTADMISQLNAVFERMEAPLILRLSLDERAVSAELQAYMEELVGLTDKLSLELADSPAREHLPKMEVLRADGSETGLAFHGVPGGHEFTSFVLGLYNASGPGQPIDDVDRAAIAAVAGPLKLQVLVSLSCTMCPELVTAAQRLAADNNSVTAEVYDIAHFPELKDAYNVMSVPCLVVNEGEKVSFGKKNLAELLEYLK